MRNDLRVYPSSHPQDMEERSLKDDSCSLVCLHTVDPSAAHLFVLMSFTWELLLALGPARRSAAVTSTDSRRRGAPRERGRAPTLYEVTRGFQPDSIICSTGGSIRSSEHNRRLISQSHSPDWSEVLELLASRQIQCVFLPVRGCVEGCRSQHRSVSFCYVLQMIFDAVCDTCAPLDVSVLMLLCYACLCRA